MNNNIRIYDIANMLILWHLVNSLIGDLSDAGNAAAI